MGKVENPRMGDNNRRLGQSTTGQIEDTHDCLERTVLRPPTYGGFMLMTLDSARLNPG